MAEFTTNRDLDRMRKVALAGLDAALEANVEPSTRLATVTTQAAKLNAAVAESSSSAMMKAAQIIAEALDRSSAASDRHGDRMWWLTVCSVVAAIALVILGAMELADRVEWM